MTKNSFQFTVIGIGVVWLGLCSQAQSTLINHWRFDETGGTTAADSAGSLHLALQGNAHFATDAAHGQVLALDGNGDYARNPNEPFTSDMPHTVGLWVNHFDPGPLYQGWISWGKWGTSGARYFFGTYSGTGGRIYAGMGSSTAFFNDSDAKPAQNTWQYWTLVRQGTTASLYLDGELVETLTVSAGGSIDTSTELRIGRQYDANLYYLHGLIDDVAIWNEALTVPQIKSAMALGAENYMVPEPCSAALLLTAVLGVFGASRLRRPHPRRCRSWTWERTT